MAGRAVTDDGNTALRDPAGAGSPVRELRLALTTDDLGAALSHYRDALGMPVIAEWEHLGGRGVVLAAGRATLELLDRAHAAHVDEVEVGRRVAGPFRIALEVGDSAAAADRLVAAGAEQLAPPIVTPWDSRNVRVTVADGVQLTLFSELGADETESRS